MEDTVSTYWDQHVGHHINSFVQWDACKPIQMHHWQLITGNADYNPVSWFWDKYGPFRNMASIACGDGILERFVAENILTGDSRIVGYDISPASVELARSLSRSPRADFQVQDANSDRWPAARFDAVFAHGGLHHIEKLDFCIGQFAHGLVEGGMLYVNDYFGPARFQFSDTQLRLAAEMLDQVPARFRSGNRPARCDAVALRDMDPSEAVCPDRTYGAIRAYFSIVEAHRTGGTLLAPLFGGSCLSPAIVESPEGLNLVAEMARAERRMIEDGVIGSDHLLLVCRKRAKPAESYLRLQNGLS
jgi:SAM-dependent methyltransferase